MKLNASNISIIKRLLASRNNRPLRAILRKFKPQDLSRLYNHLNTHEARIFTEALMSVHKIYDAMHQLPKDRILWIFSLLSSKHQLDFFKKAPPDEGAYFLNLIEKEKKSYILEHISQSQKKRIQQILNYPENTAGRNMTTQVFTLNENLNAQCAIESIRKHEESLYYVYCTDKDSRLKGVLSLRDLVTAPADKPVSEIMKREIITVMPSFSSQKVAQLVNHYDFVALPVIESDGELIGLITVDDVLDIIQEQATADAYASAGLQEGDRICSSPLFSFKNRLPWMFINLFLATLVSLVVAQFEKTMSELIILATLNNIVAGVGGNTAIQSLTVMTRGLAIGDLRFTTISKAWLKEVTVGLGLGLITGISAGFLVYFWKNNLTVSIVISIAMLINSLVAASFGTLIPIFLKRLNWDPTSGSGVIVTTITDVFGFFSFLGIASLALKAFG